MATVIESESFALDELVDEYVSVRAARDKRSKKLQELGDRIKAIVKPGSSIILEGGVKVCVTEPAITEKVDRKKLKSEYPDVYHEVVVEAELASSLRVTVPRTEDDTDA